MLSRREFVAYTAAMSIPVGAPLRSSCDDCVVLPVLGQCSLPESILGYRCALAHVKTPLLVIPAVVEIPRKLGYLMCDRLRDGWTVLVESGGAFTGTANFGAHRRSLQHVLNVELGEPVNLWADRRSRAAPYVDYVWPAAAKIRDFSRAVPVGAQASNVIAYADGLPVALQQRIGSGTLIVLGSPLGPALWVGDREAQGWLQSLTASAPPPASAR